MKQITGIVLTSVLFFSFSTLAAQNIKIRKEISQSVLKLAADYKAGKDLLSRKNVAIAEFKELTPTVKKNSLGETVRGLVATEISRSTVFALVERNDLEKIVKEQQLQMTGLTDPTSASKIGLIMNADLILTGTVSELGGSIQLVLNLIDVETGAVLTDTVSFKKEDAVETAQAVLNMAYVQEMGVGIAINMFGCTTSGDYAVFNPIANFSGWNETGFAYPVGAEVRYRFTRNLMLGIGIDLVTAQVWAIPNQRWEVPIGLAGNKTNSAPFRIVADGISIPIMLYANINPTRRLNLFAGAGCLFHLLDYSGLFYPSNGNGFGLNEFGPVLDNYNFLGARFVCGFELFLTPRAAISTRAGYDYRQTELDLNPIWHLPGLPKQLDVDMSGFAFQTSLAFYF